jgi:hypothetical protein
VATPIRVRDLNANLKEHGYERGLAITLARLLDEYVEHRQHMRELTKMVSTCVDLVARMIHTGDELQKRIEQIRRDREQGEHDEDGQH